MQAFKSIPDSLLKPRSAPDATGGADAGGPPGRWAGTASLHGAVLLFGAAGLFAKWVAASALVIVFGRVAVASAAFALLLRLRPLRGPRPDWRSLAPLWACGALLAVHWVSFFHSIQVSTVAVGLLAYSTAPVFAVLLEPLWFRERLSPTALVCALITVAGVALIIPRWAPGSATLHGVAWGVLAGLTFAVLALFNRALVRRHAAVRVAFHQDLAAMVLLAPLLPLVWSPLTPRDLALLAVLGLFCTALAHTLFIAALAALPARTAAITSALEPVYGIALAWLLLGEVPAARTLAGGALILAAVVWATLHSTAAAG